MAWRRLATPGFRSTELRRVLIVLIDRNSDSAISWLVTREGRNQSTASSLSVSSAAAGRRLCAPVGCQACPGSGPQTQRTGAVPGATWPNRLYSPCGSAVGSRDDRPPKADTPAEPRGVAFLYIMVVPLVVFWAIGYEQWPPARSGGYTATSARRLASRLSGVGWADRNRARHAGRRGCTDRTSSRQIRPT